MQMSGHMVVGSASLYKLLKVLHEEQRRKV